MKDLLMVLVMIVPFACGYLAVDRLSRLMDGIRRDRSCPPAAEPETETEPETDDAPAERRRAEELAAKLGELRRRCGREAAAVLLGADPELCAERGPFGTQRG